MKKIVDAWRRYKYLGYNAEIIAKCRPKMDEDNVNILRQVSCLLMILVGVLTAFYLLFDNRLLRNVICISGALLMLGIYLISRMMAKKMELQTSSRVDRLIDIFSIICFLIGIYLGTFAAGDELAVAPVWMFFFAILIFNRLPFQNLYTVLAAGIVFIFCSYILKSTHNFLYDAMHAVTSIIAALFMSWSKSRMKIENILALEKLESANLEIMETMKEQEWEAALLRYKASRDELTGLFNKSSFQNKVENMLEHSKEKDMHAFVCLDLDDFKFINDENGHLFGDFVLKCVSEILKEEMSDSTFGSRFGGDEFVLFCAHITEKEEAEIMVQNILEACMKRKLAENKECRISLSAGISIYPDNGMTYEELFERADEALYHSKNKGKNQYTISL